MTKIDNTRFDRMSHTKSSGQEQVSVVTEKCPESPSVRLSVCRRVYYTRLVGVGDGLTQAVTAACLCTTA